MPHFVPTLLDSPFRNDRCCLRISLRDPTNMAVKEMQIAVLRSKKSVNNYVNEKGRSKR